MKRFILFVFLLVSTSVFSQDTIVMKSGERIFAQVTEITPDVIRFKVHTFDGMNTYWENKKKIELIIYYNGAVEDFGKTFYTSFKKAVAPVFTRHKRDAADSTNKMIIKDRDIYYHDMKINEHDMAYIITSTKDKELMALLPVIRKKQKWQYIGFAAFPCAIASICLAYNSKYFSELPNKNVVYFTNSFAVVFGLGIMVCPGIGATIADKHNELKRKAIKLYNEKY